MSTSLTTSSADLFALAAQANILAGSTPMVKRLDDDLKKRYLQAFADSMTNMESGETLPEDRPVLPKPPNAWDLAPPNSDGHGCYQVGTTPICDMPPLPYYSAGNAPPNKLLSVILMGENTGGKWSRALPGDTFPNGQTTPPIPRPGCASPEALRSAPLKPQTATAVPRLRNRF